MIKWRVSCRQPDLSISVNFVQSVELSFRLPKKAALSDCLVQALMQEIKSNVQSVVSNVVISCLNHRRHLWMQIVNQSTRRMQFVRSSAISYGISQPLCTNIRDQLRPHSHAAWTDPSGTPSISMTSLFMPLHVAPNAKILATSFVFAFVGLFASVRVSVDLKRARSRKRFVACGTNVSFLSLWIGV